MRPTIALVIASTLLLGGCASFVNRPPQPAGNYWPINKQQPQSSTPAGPSTAANSETTGGNE